MQDITNPVSLLLFIACYIFLFSSHAQHTVISDTIDPTDFFPSVSITTFTTLQVYVRALVMSSETVCFLKTLHNPWGYYQ